MCICVHIRGRRSRGGERLLGNREGKGWGPSLRPGGHSVEDAGKAIRTLHGA